MCGIAGIINFHKPVSGGEILEMQGLLQNLSHRGPDAQGTHRCSQTVLFGGTRLRMTDAANPGADLPMTFGRYTITMNGEIYNHKEIRRSLPGIAFRTQSDTETVMAAYAVWGAACLSRFEGMFAFAIHDRLTGEVFLARDPTGQKPLYYLQDKNSIVFASEITALIADTRREKSFCPKGLSEYITQRMILGTDTHIREIKKMESGTFIKVTPNGAGEPQRYYHVPLGDQQADNVEELAQALQEKMLAACNRTFDMEHPPALLLSGGIDSTGVLAAAHRAGHRPVTYSIGFAPFEGKNFGIPTTFNEFDPARQAAAAFGAEHREIAITPREYLDAIHNWTGMMGEPLDASEAPMLSILMNRIKQDGFRLVLCGSGPDEIHDGYGLGPQLSDIAPMNIAAGYYDRLSWIFSVSMDSLMPHAARETRERVVGKMNRFLAPYRAACDDTTQLAQLINFHGRLSEYEFRQMDVTSMRHGIEVRTPLIDRSLVAQAFDYNPALKRRDGQSKWLYKQAWRGIVPDAIVDRPKVGFPTPIEFWFTETYEKELGALTSANSMLATLGLVDVDYLKKIWATPDPAYRCIDYRLYCLEILLQQQTALMNRATPTERLTA